MTKPQIGAERWRLDHISYKTECRPATTRVAKSWPAFAQRLEEIKGELDSIAEQEQEYFDNMPEDIQAGEKGDHAESCIASIEEAASNIDDVISSIEEATS